jgi:hypothetical protein
MSNLLAKPEEGIDSLLHSRESLSRHIIGAGISIYDALASICLGQFPSTRLSIDQEGIRGEYVCMTSYSVLSMCGGYHSVLVERSLLPSVEKWHEPDRTIHGTRYGEDMDIRGIGLVEIIDTDVKRLRKLNAVLKRSNMNNKEIPDSDYRISYDGKISKPIADGTYPSLVGIFCCDWVTAHDERAAQVECYSCGMCMPCLDGEYNECPDCGNSFIEYSSLSRCISDTRILGDSRATSFVGYQLAKECPKEEVFDVGFDLNGGYKVSPQVASIYCNHGIHGGNLRLAKLGFPYWKYEDDSKYHHNLPWSRVMPKLGLDPDKSWLDTLVGQAAHSTKTMHFPLFITCFGVQASSTPVVMARLCSLTREEKSERGLDVVRPRFMGTNPYEGFHYIYGIAVVVTNPRKFLNYYGTALNTSIVDLLSKKENSNEH